MITTFSILIPVFNEQDTIHLIIDKIKKVQLAGDISKEIIIVDDCSSDDSLAAIEKYKLENQNIKIQVLKHTINQGKGAALHFGIKNATKEGTIIQDVVFS